MNRYYFFESINVFSLAFIFALKWRDNRRGKVLVHLVHGYAAAELVTTVGEEKKERYTIHLGRCTLTRSTFAGENHISPRATFISPGELTLQLYTLERDIRSHFIWYSTTNLQDIGTNGTRRIDFAISKLTYTSAGTIQRRG